MSFEYVPISEITSPPDPEERLPIVLVVDDEIVIADTLATILSKNGFAAIAAYGGKSALEIAKAIPPDLLFTDIAMPGMNGIELAIAVSERIPDCRVMLFSAHSPLADKVSESRAARLDFPVLIKPIHPTVLLESISRCLADFAPIAEYADSQLAESDEWVMFPPRIEINSN